MGESREKPVTGAARVSVRDRELRRLIERTLEEAGIPVKTIPRTDVDADRLDPAETDLVILPVAREEEEAPGLPKGWADRPLPEVRDEIVSRIEREYLTRLLTRTRGRVGRAAELAGISPRSLYDKMKRLGLEKEDFKA